MAPPDHGTVNVKSSQPRPPPSVIAVISIRVTLEYCDRSTITTGAIARPVPVRGTVAASAPETCTLINATVPVLLAWITWNDRALTGIGKSTIVSLVQSTEVLCASPVHRKLGI